MDVRKTIRARARINRGIRRFFERRAYLEVETPRLVPDPIPERHIRLFETEYRHGATMKLYLLPSPERYLKELLAAGSGNVFEFARSFRNGESLGPHHAPEFTMLEWYTLGAGASDSLELTIELLRELGVSGDVTVMTMCDAFDRFAGMDLEASLERPAMARACEGASLSVGQNETWEDLFQRAFLTLVEPNLPRQGPLFITHYPSAIPTLAGDSRDRRWADRWELYINGVEIANCFGEETDPARIAAFVEGEHDAVRADLGEADAPPAPKAFLSPAYPLPVCSGVALGVDRLVMHLTGARSLSEVSLFPLSAMIAAQQKHDKEA